MESNVDVKSSVNNPAKNKEETPNIALNPGLRLKLVEYDESDSSNDSNESKDNKTTVPKIQENVIEDSANLKNEIVNKCNSVSDNDSEKSQDGYNTKELSAQDIDLIIMGGPEKHDSCKSDTLKPILPLDILEKDEVECNIEDNKETTENVRTEKVIPENLDSNRDDTIISSDLINNKDQIQNVINNPENNETTPLEQPQDKTIKDDLTNDSLNSTREIDYNNSIRSIDDMETELIQITEIDFAKLPLDDNMPGSSQELEDSLLNSEIIVSEEMETENITNSRKVQDTDDELEFFDCETDLTSTDSKRLKIIEEDIDNVDVIEKSSSELVNKEIQNEILDKNISKSDKNSVDNELIIKETSEISQENITDENNETLVEKNIHKMDSIDIKNNHDEISDDDNVEDDFEESSKTQTIANTCHSVQNDMVIDEITENKSSVEENTTNKSAESLGDTAMVSEEFADKTVSSTIPNHLENTNIMHEEEIELDDRKVQPLKLNLTNVDLSSPKSKLKRPAKVSPDSSQSAQKMAKKLTNEHEPIPKLTIRKIIDTESSSGENDLNEQMDVTVDITPKVTIKPLKYREHSPGTPKITIKPIPVPEEISKLTIVLPKDDEISKFETTETVPKFVLKLDKKDHVKYSDHETVPKLTIKPILKPETEIIPKLTLKLPVESNVKDLSSESETEETKVIEHDIVPKLTIKPIPKPETETVPKLTLKLPPKTESINEVPVIPKLTIKPVIKPDSETVPKLTLKLCPDAESKMDNTLKVPKLTLKLPSEISNEPTGELSKETSESECDEESQIVPKLTIKLPQEINTDLKHEEHTTVPKLTIKPILKPESETVPKLTVKLSSTGEHHIENLTKPDSSTSMNEDMIPKITIKTGAKINEESTTIPKLIIKPVVKPETSPVRSEIKTSPRLTIKPLSKLTEPVVETVPKLTLKLPSDLTIDSLEHHTGKETNTIPKFTIKPIPTTDHNQPLEIITTDKSLESGQESPRIILKINKTVQGSKSEILSPSMDVQKSPSIDKIKLKLSKTGQHPHIVHNEEEDPNTICMKRALMNPDLDVIEIKRPKNCHDLYNRLPDVSIERVQPKQTEKQRSEKRLKDILSRLHKKSNEAPPSQQQNETMLHRILLETGKVNQNLNLMENDNSSSSGDCVIIEESDSNSKTQYINFGRDIELINISQQATGPSAGGSPGMMRGMFPRKRGRPRKEIGILTKRSQEDGLVRSIQELQGHQILDGMGTEGVMGRSRRNLRGRSPIVRGPNTPRGTRRGSGQSRRGSLHQQTQQQATPTNSSPGKQLNQATPDQTSPTRTPQTQPGTTNPEVLDLTEAKTPKTSTVVSNSDPLTNLQALTSSIPIDLTGQDDSQEEFRPTSPSATPNQTQESPFAQLSSETPSTDFTVGPPPMKTPQSTRARSRRARGSRSKATARQRKNVKESPLPMFEEDTRMSADLGNKTAPNTPSKPGTTEGNEESQSSVLSSANENSKTKRGRMEVGDCDGKVEFTVDQIAEYQWPQPQSPEQGAPHSLTRCTSESYMIQEQIALYLGVTSFKRKYPDVKRRPLDMQERDYVMGRQLVTETLCDLGLTAIPTCEVLDIMSADFPQKYDEYKKYLRDKQAKELALRTKAFNSDRNKQRSIKDRAISSASSWNNNFNKERLENRRGCTDLQTYVIQRPKKSQINNNNTNNNKTGNYPIALVPGQYCDYYKHYSPNELRYFPLDTVLYGPQKPNQRFDNENVDRNDTQSESSESSDSSSDSDSDSSSDDSQGNDDPIPSSEPLCKLCRLGKPGQELIQCTSCRAQLHATCTGLSSSSLIVSRGYAWKCQDCKACSKCGVRGLTLATNIVPGLTQPGAQTPQVARMLRCERCDRAIHASCIVGAGLAGSQPTPVSLRWSCPGQCGSCDSCGVSGNAPGGSEIRQWRHVRTPVGMRQLCQPCALMWQDKRYCTVCYRCVLDSQQFIACKICSHKLHADCVRRQYSNNSIDTVTCLECTKRAVVRVSTNSTGTHFSSEASTNTTTGKIYNQNNVKIEQSVQS